MKLEKSRRLGLALGRFPLALFTILPGWLSFGWVGVARLGAVSWERVADEGVVLAVETELA